MEDSQILDLFWARHEDAIKETDIKYGSICSQIAFNLLLNYQDAEECVNDTYFGLWNTIPPRRPVVFSSYIAKLVRNIAMNKLTFLNAQKRSSYGVVYIHEIEQTIPDGKTIDEHLSEEELAAHITKFLSTLDYESRNMFLRRYWFFDSIAEIASRFRVSQSKVKSQLFRTRNRLYAFLVKEGLIDDRTEAYQQHE